MYCLCAPRKHLHGNNFYELLKSQHAQGNKEFQHFSFDNNQYDQNNWPQFFYSKMFNFTRETIFESEFHFDIEFTC